MIKTELPAYDGKAKCLDVIHVDNGTHKDDGANIQIYDCNQLFEMRHLYTEDGGIDVFEIKAQVSGKCLDIADSPIRATDNRANIQQWKCNESTVQQWRLIPR